VGRAEVVLLISKTGCGKSFLCQALGNAACSKLIPTRYLRLADVFDRLNRSRAFDAASYYSFMDDLKSVQLLILDDFLTTPIATQNAVDLFEILEGRNEKVATLIASQLELHEWYLWIEGESMADSILGRVASAARRYDLDGPDMRRYFAQGMPEL